MEEMENIFVDLFIANHWEAIEEANRAGWIELPAADKEIRHFEQTFLLGEMKQADDIQSFIKNMPCEGMAIGYLSQMGSGIRFYHQPSLKIKEAAIKWRRSNQKAFPIQPDENWIMASGADKFSHR